MAKCLFRECRAVRASHSLAISETVSMKKPPTGEPYAGKPPVRFGGRGRRKPIPTPIRSFNESMIGFGFVLSARPGMTFTNVFQLPVKILLVGVILLAAFGGENLFGDEAGVLPD